MEPRELSTLIKQRARELGFTACGITRATAVSDDMRRQFDEWIASGANGGMNYMAGNYEKRMDPTLLVEGCRSIIVVAQNYYTSNFSPYLSRYAQGKDYHKVVKDKLFQLLQYINQLTPTKGRAFCDSAPVLERYWAVQAGLGWCGKNRQLVVPHAGTHFFLGELFIDTETAYDAPYTATHCGNCNACIENCPTGALSNKGLDARKCLSYLTIEHRDKLPGDTGEKMGECFYGCDRCQSVCPHNRHAHTTDEKLFYPSEALLEMQASDWAGMTQERFDELFHESAVQRCGYLQLMRNIEAWKRNR